MPPKKKANEPNKKTQEKQKQKVVEDKTFGIKNKKGAKQQKFIQHVQKTVLQSGKSAKQLAKDQEDKLNKKDVKKMQQMELNSLFKPVDQKVSKGVDPKSVLCAFFKAGSCTKGDKCKFSHDLNIARKGEKRNIYEAGEAEAEENMDNWDEAKLEEVVNKKHGESNKKKATTTTIICKYFLDAVENNKYGWFWECPNGQDCKYKHTLPPGFQLKKDQKRDEKKDEISLEELIEKERASLSSNNLTKVTLESFMKWKAKKKQEKIKEAMKAKDARKKDFTQGKASGISGREMFEFNPDLVVDNAEDGEEGADVDLNAFKHESDDEEEEKVTVKDIDLAAMAAAAQEADDTGTKRTDKPAPATSNGLDASPPTQHEDETNKLSMAAGGASSTDPGLDDAIADVPIDENLFDGDDLLDIENELEQMDLEA